MSTTPASSFLRAASPPLQGRGSEQHGAISPLILWVMMSWLDQRAGHAAPASSIALLLLGRAVGKVGILRSGTIPRGFVQGEAKTQAKDNVPHSLNLCQPGAPIESQAHAVVHRRMHRMVWSWMRASGRGLSNRVPLVVGHSVLLRHQPSSPWLRLTSFHTDLTKCFYIPKRENRLYPRSIGVGAHSKIKSSRCIGRRREGRDGDP